MHCFSEAELHILPSTHVPTFPSIHLSNIHSISFFHLSSILVFPKTQASPISSLSLLSSSHLSIYSTFNLSILPLSFSPSLPSSLPSFFPPSTLSSLLIHPSSIHLPSIKHPLVFYNPSIHPSIASIHPSFSLPSFPVFVFVSIFLLINYLLILSAGQARYQLLWIKGSPPDPFLRKNTFKPDQGCSGPGPFPYPHSLFPEPSKAPQLSLRHFFFLAYVWNLPWSSSPWARQKLYIQPPFLALCTAVLNPSSANTALGRAKLLHSSVQKLYSPP